MTTKLPITYTGPTPNPELDAARHDDELEAADDFRQEAAREAPGIVLKQLQAIKKPGDWYDKFTFHGGNCAEDILRDGMSADDDVADAYAEYMLDATPAAREKLLVAMANNHANLYALEIYTDYVKGL